MSLETIFKKFDIRPLCIFAYLAALFFFPTYIRYETVAFFALVLFYDAVCIRSLQIDLTHILWVLYAVFGFCISIRFMRLGSIKLINVLEFLAAIAVGLVSVVCREDAKARKSVLTALSAMCLVVLLGIFVQLAAPGFLEKFNALRLSQSQFATFRDFLRGHVMVGFSYQTAVTGFYLSILSGIFFCFGLTASKKYAWIYYVLSFGVFTAVFFTGKRIFILLIPFIFVLMFFACKKRRVRNVLIVLGVTAAALVVLLCCTDMGRELISRTLGENPTTHRDEQFLRMMEMFLERPLFGNGLTSGRHSLPGYYNGHNIYAQVLCETGVIGFAIMAVIAFKNLIGTVKLVRNESLSQNDKLCANVCLYVQLLFLGWGCTGNPLYSVYPLVVYMIVCGLAANINAEIKKRV